MKRKKQILIALVLLFSASVVSWLGLTFHAWKNSPAYAAQQQQSLAEFRHNVDAFMSGQDVVPWSFPWYEDQTKRCNTQVLEAFLRQGRINQAEYDAFHDVELCWKKPKYVRPHS